MTTHSKWLSKLFYMWKLINFETEKKNQGRILACIKLSKQGL